MTLTPMAAIILGIVLALWLGAAVWALASGQRMRREGMQAQGKLDRLAMLLASAPAAPVVIHPDGKLEAADRLAKWLGKPRVPTFASELIAADGGLEPDDAAALAREIASAQKAGKSFALPVRGVGSSRLLSGDIPAALGHPRVFLEIDEHGYVDCGYCDRRFVLIGSIADTGDIGSKPDIASGASL